MIKILLARLSLALVLIGIFGLSIGYSDDSLVFDYHKKLDSGCNADNSSSTADGLILSVPVKIQEQSNWCWAASSQAIISYYGKTLNQCDISNYAWSLSSCCSDPSNQSTCNKNNYTYGESGSVQDILSHWGVSSQAYDTYLSEDMVMSEINAGRPFVILWKWASGGGHFVVGIGVNYCHTLTYMNPLEGYSTDLYSSVVKTSSHSWVNSLRLTTKAPYVFSFNGSFSKDNDIQKFSFAVGTRTSIILKTSSYAGGTSASGQTVSSGGFDPILAVFDSTGRLIANNDDGGACLVPADRGTGRYFDTLLKINLDVGNYYVVVSQYPNFAVGPDLSNGFRYDGAESSNFTHQYSNDSPGYFYDVTGTRRNGSWEFDVYSANVATKIEGIKIIPALPLLLGN